MWPTSTIWWYVLLYEYLFVLIVVRLILSYGTRTWYEVVFLLRCASRVLYRIMCGGRPEHLFFSHFGLPLFASYTAARLLLHRGWHYTAARCCCCCCCRLLLRRCRGEPPQAERDPPLIPPTPVVVRILLISIIIVHILYVCFMNIFTYTRNMFVYACVCVYMFTSMCYIPGMYIFKYRTSQVPALGPACRRQCRHVYLCFVHTYYTCVLCLLFSFEYGLELTGLRCCIFFSKKNCFWTFLEIFHHRRTNQNMAKSRRSDWTEEIWGLWRAERGWIVGVRAQRGWARGLISLRRSASWKKNPPARPPLGFRYGSLSTRWESISGVCNICYCCRLSVDKVQHLLNS